MTHDMDEALFGARRPIFGSCSVPACFVYAAGVLKGPTSMRGPRFSWVPVPRSQSRLGRISVLAKHPSPTELVCLLPRAAPLTRCTGEVFLLLLG